jgi:hypothetical protein
VSLLQNIVRRRVDILNNKLVTQVTEVLLFRGDFGSLFIHDFPAPLYLDHCTSDVLISLKNPLLTGLLDYYLFIDWLDWTVGLGPDRTELICK